MASTRSLDLIPKPNSICSNCRAWLVRRSSQPRRSLHGSRLRAGQAAHPAGEGDPAMLPPRWMKAPERMTAPFPSKARNKNDDFPCNEDPKLLDEVLEAVIGTSVRGTDFFLEEEIKWLAVTHKSFSHGTVGMNDRMALLGRSICELQVSLALLDAPDRYKTDFSDDLTAPDPALIGIENLSPKTKLRILNPSNLSRLAQRYDLQKVIRWKPRQISNMQSSGIDSVLTQTLYAIVGAAALQRGGDVAARLAKERILRPLGII